MSIWSALLMLFCEKGRMQQSSVYIRLWKATNKKVNFSSGLVIGVTALRSRHNSIQKSVNKPTQLNDLLFSV